MKKHKVTVSISLGILLLIGVLSAFFLNGSTPVMASFKYDPGRGCTYSGTGYMDIGINLDKLKLVTGFQEGELGNELVETLKNKISSLDMDMTFEGSSKDGEELSVFRIFKQGTVMLESKSYINGDQRWVSVSEDGNGGNWQYGGQSDPIADVWSSFSLEDIAKLKDYFVLKSRDDNFTIFSLDVTAENIPMLFNSWSRKSFESLAEGNDFTGFIKNMDMSMEITVPGYKNAMLPADRISKIKIHFVLPLDSLNNESPNWKSRQFGAEEKKIFDSFFIDVSLDMNFFYDNIIIERPAL